MAEPLMINVATVDTPELHIIKAKAVLADNHLTVYDRRSGRAIIDLDETRVDGGTVFTYGDIVVTQMGGCGCGGTIITEKEKV
jgi:hypothetical protein